jgi:hypothetical protein
VEVGKTLFLNNNIVVLLSDNQTSVPMAAKVSSPRNGPYSGNSRTGPSLLHKLAPTKFIRCVVEMLDDSDTEVDVEVCHYSQYLLNIFL